jgi:hypothetical protein
MVEVPPHHVVDVIAVGDRLVLAIRPVLVFGGVRAARVRRCAARRIFLVHLERVLVDVIAVRIMEVPIVEIVLVITVPDLEVPTVGTVRVGMALVNLVCAHDASPGALFVRRFETAASRSVGKSVRPGFAVLDRILR